SISERQVREALQIKEGDPAPDDLEGAKRGTAHRLMSLQGVVDASISLVCCDAGKAILFVGIGENGVRNNAMRALAVMAGSAPQTDKIQIRIPVRPFIEMLNGVEWTDRNKSSWALLRLTEKRDPAVLSELRQKALPSLIEMARWKSSGHAYASFTLLGRVVGLPEDEITAAWERGDRASFIDTSVKKP